MDKKLKQQCPQCNYPGIVNCGEEKGSEYPFGIYIKGELCGYCGHKEKIIKFSEKAKVVACQPNSKLSK